MELNDYHVHPPLLELNGSYLFLKCSAPATHQREAAFVSFGDEVRWHQRRCQIYGLRTNRAAKQMQRIRA